MMWHYGYPMTCQALFSRKGSVAEAIEQWIRSATMSVDVAIYRLTSARLALALAQAFGCGLSVRLVLDGTKYLENSTTRDILAGCQFPWRLAGGRSSQQAKLHHKFAILDSRMVLTGSYNWTAESEEQNYENLVALSDIECITLFLEEFEALWAGAVEAR